MRSLFLPLVAVLVLPAAVRADDAADARAIVEKGVKATGYKLDDKVGAMTWKEAGKFTGGGFEMKYTGNWAYQSPDKYHFAINGEFGGMKIAISLIANGGKAWESAMGMSQEITGDKLDYVKGEVYQMRVTSLLPLLHEKEFKLATAGEKEINKKAALGVKVTCDKQTPITLYFDKATGLLAKAEGRVKDEFQQWKEVSDEAYFEDYKEVDGKKLFGKIKIVRDGKPLIESILSDQKRPEKLDPKLFDKP